MNNLVKVSVIIPVYNSSEFIEAAILSSLRQNSKKIEIIIIDDGSTDDSLWIAKKYQSENVHIFQQKNKGACAARNLGFQKAKGQYIQFLDSDDILAPEKISSQLKLFSQYGDEIVVNSQWGRFYDTIETVKWEKQVIDKDYNNPYDWLCDSWMGKGMAQTSTWLTPRSLIEQAGPWNESLLINQDGEFFSRVLLKAKSIKFCNEAKVYYRSGNASSISQANVLSYPKAHSLLQSYKSYERILAVDDSFKIRQALGQNYLSFIYRFHSLFPDLANEAKTNFHKLGFNRMWPVGGKYFKTLASIIGFNNALQFKKMIKTI